MATANHFEIIQKLYIAYYQRPADPAGLKYWADQVAAHAGDASPVVNAFANSPESVALYRDATTIGDVIDKIYLALFNRLPDAAGKAFYVSGFNAGTFSPGSIALDVLNGASNDDNTAIQHKVQVANLFTAQVDGRDVNNPAFGTGTSFQATYSGSGDEQAARAILKTVTSDPTTVLSPAQVTERIQNTIADAGDPISPPLPSPFAVTNTAGVLAFAGSGTGDITFTVATDGVATFVRGGVTATTTPNVNDIISAGGSTIKLSAAPTDLSVVTAAKLIAITGYDANGNTYSIKDAFEAVKAANALVLTTASTVTVNGTTAIDTIDMSDVGRGLIIDASDGADTVTGTAFADTIIGGVGADTITGGAGGDVIHGGDGADVIYGGAGNDTITGDIGADVITGGAGADTITGGAGADMIIYNAVATEGGDTITDFTIADADVLQFSSADLIGVAGFATFTGVGTAFALSGGQKVQFVFATGGALVASEAQAAFLFDTASGALRFDADGTGAGEAITIATLTGVAVLDVAAFSFVA